jgi:hypothetical protein
LAIQIGYTLARPHRGSYSVGTCGRAAARRASNYSGEEHATIEDQPRATAQRARLSQPVRGSRWPPDTDGIRSPICSCLQGSLLEPHGPEP